MKRRRLIALISICTLAALGLMAVGTGLVVMHTDIARNFVQRALAASINGTVYVGRISGNPFSGLTIDTLMIRDRTGEIVVSSGPITGDYDIRDMMDSRFYLRHVTAEHPYVHLRQFQDETWNYKRLMRRTSGKPARKSTARAWGDFFVLDSVRVQNATFLLSLRWSPDTVLHGAKRDSAVRYELSRKDRKIAKTPDGFARTYMWTRASGLFPHMRFADPDSNKFGKEVQIAKLDVNEFDPPFRFRKVNGVVRVLGDSAWLNLSHFDLPASTGSATGKIVWGSNLPIRYDLLVHGDSVALADVNWVYPTLPRTGGGSMDLTISNKRNVRVIDYRIHKMDMRSTGSHLVGEMTFGVGGPVLQLRNVNLKADPVDFDLIETISGAPFPIDSRGQIFGDVRATGGPLTEFEIDAANATWRDTHVPGAVSRLSGSGGLNILKPALAEFRGFDVDVASLDLRSIQFLFPAFPKLDGTIAGRATLDSIWTDVRFADASIYHRDGPGTPSHFTGSGRVTDGSPFITYDLDLIADPLSFDMLARSFPGIKLRGLASGPLKIQGQSPDLQINAVLASAGGSVRFAGNIDIDSLGGFGAQGRGDVTNVNVSRLLMTPDAPLTSLTGKYSLDIRGSSASNLRGSAQIKFDRSTYDRIAVDSTSSATIRFENGKASIADTLRIRSPLGVASVVGALGLPGAGTDSINVTLTIDSIGRLRPLFAAGDSATPPDSLTGAIVVNGIVAGSLDSLLIRGAIAGENLYIRGMRAEKLMGTFALFDVLRSPNGSIDADLKRVTLGGLEFDTAKASIRIADTAHAAYAVTAGGAPFDSLLMTAAGSLSSLAGTSSVRIDNFGLTMGDATWLLDQGATIVADSTMFRIDSIGLRNGRGGSIGLAGIAPRNGLVDLRVSALQVPLADLDRVAGRMRAPVQGLADLHASIGGTRDLLTINATTALDSIVIADVRIGRLLGNARYANRLGSIDFDIFQDNKRVLHGVADSLPLLISLFRLDTLPGPVRATAQADSADFTLIQTFVEDIQDVKGKVFGSMSLDGSWAKPNLSARASLIDGAMRIDTLGIQLTNMKGAAEFRRDSLIVDWRLPISANSGGANNSASIWGDVVFDKWDPSILNLSVRMTDFLAYNRPELATIYARTETDSGVVRLFGPLKPNPLTGVADSLTGVINVNRGAIYLPDPKFVGKTFAQRLAGDDSVGVGRLRRAADTMPTLLDRVTEYLKTDLRVHLGGEFKLSADYADVPLSGDLRIVPVTINTGTVERGASGFFSRVAPEGTVYADRGTYSLDLLPLRRDFVVQRGGTITFDRDAEWNGLMAISARYNVRPFGRPEVPIIVDVADRLLTPRVSLRSDASYPISDSDLLSYLVFNEPGFDILGQANSLIKGTGLVALFSPLATSYGSSILRNKVFKGWIDQFRFETANVDQSTTGTNQFDQLFFGTRFAGEKELLRNKVFVTFSGGLCGFKPEYKSAMKLGVGQSLYEQVGVNLDWRLASTMNTGATWKVATEPSTAALLCSPGYSGQQGAAPTPRQYSLSFLKFWRW